VNIADTNTPGVARCVRAIIDQVQLPRGPRESFRYRLAW
jgi:hypothetical protein